MSYPWSHSLITSMVWALLLGGIYWIVRRNGRGALVLGVLVMSHWILDVVTHRPDIPVTISEDHLLGLGLWNHVGATIIIELLLFAAGISLYVTATRPRSRRRNMILWSLVVFLLVIYAGNVFGPPPPSVMAVAVAGHAIWLLVLWAYWADRTKAVAPPTQGTE